MTTNFGDIVLRVTGGGEPIAHYCQRVDLLPLDKARRRNDTALRKLVSDYDRRQAIKSDAWQMNTGGSNK